MKGLHKCLDDRSLDLYKENHHIKIYSLMFLFNGYGLVLHVKDPYL